MPQKATSSIARFVCNQSLAFGAKGEILANTIAVDHAILIVAPYIAFGLFVLFDDLHGWVLGGDQQFQLGALLGLFEGLELWQIERWKLLLSRCFATNYKIVIC